jgi:hypothetical protein
MVLPKALRLADSYRIDEASEVKEERPTKWNYVHYAIAIPRALTSERLAEKLS